MVVKDGLFMDPRKNNKNSRVLPSKAPLSEFPVEDGPLGGPRAYAPRDALLTRGYAEACRASGRMRVSTGPGPPARGRVSKGRATVPALAYPHLEILIRSLVRTSFRIL